MQDLIQHSLTNHEETSDQVPQETLLENMTVERIAIAPGEGQVPMDLIIDEDSEELSYPTIYCGVKRNTSAYNKQGDSIRSATI